jgi:hypothetical protein
MYCFADSLIDSKWCCIDRMDSFDRIFWKRIKTGYRIEMIHKKIVYYGAEAEKGMDTESEYLAKNLKSVTVRNY